MLVRFFNLKFAPNLTVFIYSTVGSSWNSFSNKRSCSDIVLHIWHIYVVCYSTSHCSPAKSKRKSSRYQANYPCAGLTKKFDFEASE